MDAQHPLSLSHFQSGQRSRGWELGGVTILTADAVVIAGGPC